MSENSHEDAAADPVAADVETRLRSGLAALDPISSAPLREHGAAYERLHDDLTAVLADIDSA